MQGWKRPASKDASAAGRGWLWIGTGWRSWMRRAGQLREIGEEMGISRRSVSRLLKSSPAPAESSGRSLIWLGVMWNGER